MVVLLGLGAVFGWLGPYGTFQDLSVVSRFVYWMIAFPVVGVGAALAMRTIAHSEPTASWPAPVQAIFGAVIVGVPSTFVVIALETIFRHAPVISAVNLLRIYASVTVVLITIGIPWAIIRSRRAREVAEPEAEQAAPAPSVLPTQTGSPFLRRIPSKLGRDLLSIATEDHYLRVTTEIGHDLILFRLSDAVAELDPALGQQVHRSFWVARRAVTKVERDESRTWLVLSNGAKVPVSQTYLPALRQAGWLDS